MAPTSSTQTSAPAMQESYVYFVVDTRSGLRLAREIRDVPPGIDGAAAAVGTMIAGALDPDYSTTWNPTTTVLGVAVAGDVITVDLSEDARRANVGSAGAAIMVQQLIWTVTDALSAPNASVQLTIAGSPAGELWGVLDWSEPIAREEPAAVRTLNQIDVPREGAEVVTPVTVAGDAAAFEANVPWRVLDQSGAEVDSGFTLTSEGMTFAPFSFDLDLPPGNYTIEISEDDPSDGAAGTPYVDTRSITVVG